MSVALYSWRHKDPCTGRWRTLAWKMTEEGARRWAEREQAKIEKISNSGEVRTAVNGYGALFFPAQSALAVEQHFDDLGAKPGDDE
jgi:hypothetical protein